MLRVSATAALLMALVWCVGCDGAPPAREWGALSGNARWAIANELARIAESDPSAVSACLNRESTAKPNRPLHEVFEACRAVIDGEASTVTAQASDTPSPAAPTAAESTAAPPPAPAPVASPPRPSPWRYTTDRDQMRESVIHHACTTSTNRVALDFPYPAAQAVRLCVRQHPRWGQDVIVRLTEGGQFTCRSYNNCIVRVRFDDGEVSGFSAAEPADGSTDSFFIANDARFVATLKRSSRVIIEAEFYRAGVQQMMFNTNDLEWPRR